MFKNFVFKTVFLFCSIRYRIRTKSSRPVSSLSNVKVVHFIIRHGVACLLFSFDKRTWIESPPITTCQDWRTRYKRKVQDTSLSVCMGGFTWRSLDDATALDFSFLLLLILSIYSYSFHCFLVSFKE